MSGRSALVGVGAAIALVGYTLAWWGWGELHDQAPVFGDLILPTRRARALAWWQGLSSGAGQPTQPGSPANTAALQAIAHNGYVGVTPPEQIVSAG